MNRRIENVCPTSLGAVVLLSSASAMALVWFANVYLHHVLDLWGEQWCRRRTRGDVIVERYADDAVFGFQSRADAETFLTDPRKRLQKFGLALHSGKTR